MGKRHKLVGTAVLAALLIAAVPVLLLASKRAGADSPTNHSIAGNISVQGISQLDEDASGINFNNPDTDSDAVIHAGGDYSASTLPGNYGNWTLKLKSQDNSLSQVRLQPNAINPPIDTTAGDQTFNATVATHMLKVHVSDAAGNPVQNTVVALVSGGGTTSLATSSGAISSTGTQDSDSLTTDFFGNVSFVAIEGFSFPQVCVSFQNGTNKCSDSITVNSDVNLAFTQDATHKISGTATVSGVTAFTSDVSSIEFYNQDSDASAPVQSDGSYAADAPYGNYASWNIKLKSEGQELSKVSLQPSSISPPINNSTADQSFNVAVPAHIVTVHVNDANGNSVPNAIVALTPGNGSTSLSTSRGSISATGSQDSNSLQSDNSGKVIFIGIAGFNYSQVCVSFQGGSNVCSDGFTLSSDISLTISETTHHVISGAVSAAGVTEFSNDGSSTISFSNPDGDSDSNVNSNGSFSANAQAGSYANWSLRLHSDTDHLGQVTLQPNSISPPIDVSNGDATFNVTIPTHHVTVHVKDSNSHPVPNALVSLVSGSGTTGLATSSGSLVASGNQASNTVLSDSSGTSTFLGIDGFTYPQICVSIPDNNGGQTNICTSTSIQLGGDVTIDISPVTMPPKPAGLTGISPTNHVALTWSIATGNYSFNIYRNNVKIGTSTSTSFTDESAPEGTNTYKVAAVNSAGEGDQSDSIQILVDYTNPSISYTINPTPNANGWNKTDTTVTFICTDTPSGVNSCPSPVTVSVDAANQAVNGTVVDKAGNTSAVTAHVNVDEALPTISAAVSTPVNADGWNNGAVTITFTCADATSGIDTCTSPVTVSGEGANQIVTGRAVDKAGNTITTTASVSIDSTKPTIVATQAPVANGSGWNNTNVVVNFTCSDAQSGIKSCSSPITLSNEVTGQSATGTAIDKAGNTNSATLSNIKIDKTAPTLGSATVAPSTITYGQSNNFSTNVSDSLSGVAAGEYFIGATDPGQGSALNLTLSNGILSTTLSTLNPGVKTVSYRAKDIAGNWTAVKMVQVTVKPKAPTGLSGSTPTNHAPALTWTAATGANHYDIYRDGTKVGSSTAASYTDSTAPANASHGYYVIAVTTDSVSSANSSTINVVYDTTAPSISGPMASNGIILFSGNETVSATTSDGLSGVVGGEYFLTTSNTAPTAVAGTGTAMTYSNGKISATFTASGNGTHYVWMRAKDAAGNWSGFVKTSYIVLL